MTPFNSPSRFILGNGRPCWLASQVALPHLLFTPLADGWEMRALIGGLWGNTKLTSIECAVQLLEEWSQSPETFCRRWFGMEPPIGMPKAWSEPKAAPTGPGALVANKSAEDLGL